MLPEPGQVLHFSEDPAITSFAPHVAATAQQPEPYVWAVDALHAPSYWFPRQCPRGMAWLTAQTTDEDRDRILGPGGGERVHAVEYGWLEALRTVSLYAYRFAAADFRPFGRHASAHVCEHEVRPLGPAEPVGDLLELYEAAGIQLRVLPNLWTFWDAVTASSLGFSGIRLRNARPRSAVSRNE
ncbi:MAG TPA: hypothetical protein VL551_18670 [Actinospica sp.]|jgi:hypothetical protein|nr:hypothetical protein [Actinospica sp.]